MSHLNQSDLYLEISETVSRKFMLSWSHYLKLMRVTIPFAFEIENEILDEGQNFPKISQKLPKDFPKTALKTAPKMALKMTLKNEDSK